MTARLLVIIFLGLAPLATGCSTVVIPPHLAAGSPRSLVYVVDLELTHTTLALPDAQNQYTMWGFGDRQYMAYNDHGVARSVWLCLPIVFSAAALEKRPVSGTTASEIKAETGARTVIEVAVDQQLIHDLRERLEENFDLTGIEFMRKPNGAVYAPTAARYNLWELCGVHNCNGAVVHWLRSLDCEVPARFPRWGPWVVHERRRDFTTANARGQR